MLALLAFACVASAQEATRAQEAKQAPEASRTTEERLRPERLEAVRKQRIEWMKTRRVDPAHGVYNEYRVVRRSCSATDPIRLAALAKEDGIDAVLCMDAGKSTRPASYESTSTDVLMLGGEGLSLPGLPQLSLGDWLASSGLDQKRWRKLGKSLSDYPDEALGAVDQPVALNPTEAKEVLGAGGGNALWKPALRNASVRVLARERKPEEIREALESGRYYIARDWLCDPAGFYFWASSNLGVYNLGESIPLVRAARLQARSPVPATFKVFEGDKLIHESTGTEFQHPIPGPGAFRLEAWLTVDGESRQWIRTSEIRAEAAPAISLPSYKIDERVEVVKDIPYVPGSTEPKQRLDLYLPKGKQNFPVLVFVHGGSWASGDKSIYAPLGNLFATKGIGVVIPSYRLMPRHPHPAQIEDTASAWAWVVKNIAERGGDPKRLFLSGHSAGGHLVSLLALDRRHLEHHGVDISTIRGVAALSGVYDLRALPQFGKSDADRIQASPIEFVVRNAPPFLVTYCQWDYLFLPLQARQFATKLKEHFVNTRLLYVPGESHISEVLSMLKEGDPTTTAVLELIRTASD